MPADPTSTRFEVVLTPEETAKVADAMAAAGIKSRAAYLRACLMADRARDGAAMAAALGAFGLILNELRLRQGAATKNRVAPGEIRA